MCLIVLAHRVHPDYPIIIAANRDEFYARPTQTLEYWSDGSDIVAGRDLEEGGTWMGVTPHGRLAALTNYREPGIRLAQAPSRGHLVSQFLLGRESLNFYIKDLELRGNDYNGFNMLLSAGGQWVYCSNRGGPPQELPPGIHGLSNHVLNTPWPKVKQSCRAMEDCLSSHRRPDMETLMQILEDRMIPADEDLPRTGVPLEWERRLGSIFIHSDIYGTRSSTVLLVTKEGAARMRERTFDRHGCTGEIELEFQIAANPPFAPHSTVIETHGSP